MFYEVFFFVGHWLVKILTFLSLSVENPNNQRENVEKTNYGYCVNIKEKKKTHQLNHPNQVAACMTKHLAECKILVDLA